MKIKILENDPLTGIVLYERSFLTLPPINSLVSIHSSEDKEVIGRVKDIAMQSFNDDTAAEIRIYVDFNKD